MQKNVEGEAGVNGARFKSFCLDNLNERGKAGSKREASVLTL
jgi:hypothetical protein